MHEKEYIEILERELVPALGCTEPIAIAYASAKAAQVLGVFPEHVNIRCSGNIIKNVKGVQVPNAGGMKGLDTAAVLGIVGGNPDKELEVLEDVTPEDIERAKALMKEGFFSCELAENVENLYIVATVTAEGHSASVTIINRHTLITEIVKDGEVLFKEDVVSQEDKTKGPWTLSIRNILEFAETVDTEKIRPVLDRQIEMNSEISRIGLSQKYGAQIGQTIMECYEDNVRTRACAKAAAGSDARMGGCSSPVVINSGSGNQGMTLSLPVIEYAKEWGISREGLYRALAVSNLTAVHLKHYIGSLSAFCGAVTAAAGVSAAITYMAGGTYEQVGNAIINTLGTVGGIVCDGAKSSCAAKIFSSVDAAILSYHLSMRGHVFQPGEGLVLGDVEETIRSIGYVGRIGMRSTDVEILNVMIDNVEV